MKLTQVYAAVAALASLNTIRAADVCAKSQYSNLSCLEGNKAAKSECAARVPPYTSTQTVTAKTTATITQSVATKSTVTVRSVYTSTVYLTSTTSTVFAYVTKTESYSTTETTYTSGAAKAERTPGPRLRRAACHTADALRSLSAMKDDAIPTAYSCIGDAAVTTTEKKTITPTTTITQVGTTTTTLIGGLTITSNSPETTETFTLTTSVTSTTTQSLAAPTYTHVWGPQSSCEDNPFVKQYQISRDIQDKDTATQMCKDVCTQTPNCTMLYVQQLFPHYGSIEPNYQCYMNDHEFDEEADLTCGLTTNIWGEADAFNAVGRGQPPK